jgi:hypothetical protein
MRNAGSTTIIELTLIFLFTIVLGTITADFISTWVSRCGEEIVFIDG